MSALPYFNAAYNLDRRCLDLYKKSGIREIFAGINFPTIFGSGRIVTHGKAVSYDELGRHFLEASRLGLNTTFLFNSACTGGKEWTAAGMNEIANVVRFINKYGVDYIVISQPMLAPVFRQLCPSVKIKLSAHYNVDCMGKLDMALDRLGFDVVVISQFANKNFRFLRQAVNRYGPERLEILCSVACMAGCPYRSWHVQVLSHIQDMDYDLFTSSAGTFPPCGDEIPGNPHILMTSTFIRREDISFYRKLGINRFKIGERMASTSYNNACVRYYTGKLRRLPRQVAEVMFRGNVEEADFGAMDGFYEKFFNEECDGTEFNCTKCGHCGDYTQKVFKPRRTGRRKGHHQPSRGSYAEFIRRMLEALD